MQYTFRILLSVIFPVLFIACGPAPDTPVAPAEPVSEAEPEFAIEFEKYTLENGLEVILHTDHSDPVVAVASIFHVGSGREETGRTGFAHFFEHMSFNDSENVPRGANRKYIAELGGSRNGGTWTDGTVYYELVPTDALEKIFWIDSDRMGYMINTVTDEALER
jgi:zinc protease